MSLTPEEFAAFVHVVTGTTDDEFEKAPLLAMANLFEAGIAHERAQCVKVCRDRAAVLEGIDDSHSRARREASINCAAAIEVPAYGGKPKE